MKLLHQVGHNGKRNLDSLFNNGIGDGFIFTAFNLEEEKIGDQISGYPFSKLIDKSFLDLQYYGGKASNGGKLNTYSFHPIHTGRTMLNAIDLITQGIEYQVNKGFKKIIIPHAYYDILNTKKTIDIILAVNKYLKTNRVEGIEYFMTLPISNDIILDTNAIDDILFAITDKDIVFDGYYVVCESKPSSRKKINDNYPYYNNMYKLLNTLHSQDFRIIYAYANFDAVIFCSLVDIDYISIGTYENQRNFDPTRYTETKSGGPSDGWYYSEKLLNMIKAKEIELLRVNNCLQFIKNDANIFSDGILTLGYGRNTHKPDVHKNYLLSISNLLKRLASIQNISDRRDTMVKLVQDARNTYDTLENHKVYLIDESSDYFLSTWYSFLMSIKL